MYNAAERLGPPLLNTHTRRAPRQPVTDTQARNLHRGSKGTGQPASRAQGRAGRATQESSTGHASVRPCCLGETMARCPIVRILTESGCKFAADVTVCSICVHMHGSCGRETPAVACVANVHAVASQRYARSARAFSLSCMAETCLPDRFRTYLSLSRPCGFSLEHPPDHAPCVGLADLTLAPPIGLRHLRGNLSSTER